MKELAKYKRLLFLELFLSKREIKNTIKNKSLRVLGLLFFVVVYFIGLKVFFIYLQK